MNHPIEHLEQIMTKLRDPEGGCPWDLKQNFETIVPHTIEETYEVVDAIHNKDWPNLQEELGDLLFQVIFYSQLAKEQGLFEFSDVVDGINEKLTRRHPHVFGSTTVNSSGDVVQNWEAITAAERAAKADSATIIKDEFDEGPLAMPALTRAHKIGRPAMKQGWQVPDAAGAFATWQQTPNRSTLGDLLLSLTMSAREQKEEAEVLLQDAVKRLVAQQRG